MTRQLLRFGIAGLGVTLLSALIYLAAVYGLRLPPLGANLVSHLLGLVAGYALHSRWSFSDRSSSDDLRTVGRFCAVSAFTFLLNGFWVAVTTLALGLPAIAPVPLMVIVTPLASFLLNRSWVFRATRGASRIG
jgi:putative flippase GtrA